MRVLICGGNGQLGLALASKYYSSGAEVARFDKSLPEVSISFGSSFDTVRNTFFSGDISDMVCARDVFSSFRPDVVINCAAIVNADRCEVEKETAYKVNFLANNNLLSLAKSNGSKFVFISSYYIFDGSGRTYVESSIPNPLNYYGITKLLSEASTLQYDRGIVARMSKIFSLGYDKRNFISRAFHSFQNDGTVRAVVDQYNNPIDADTAAVSIASLVDSGFYGCCHIGGLDYVNNDEFARLFASSFGLDSSRILPVPTIDCKQDAPRPMNVELSIDLLLSMGVHIPRLEETFSLMRKKVSGL